MNAHNPFDTKQDWTNPYCQNSSNDPMVDALLGNAYHVVRTVYCNLGNLKLLYDFLNQYGMVLGVQSEAELKALTADAKYARIYGFSRAGDRQVTDYLYVEGDRTGIIPDDTTATGSWITVATSGSTGGGTSSGEGAYIPWVYANGSATGGETTINVPDGTVGVPFIIVNGDMQYVGRGFEFNVDNLSVTLAQPLEEGDEVVFLLTGVPAVPDNPHVNDWVQINWLYNNGAAVGGEQVIAIPYTFQSIPAVYKNGLRLYKGLTTESYTADPDNQRIFLTEPLATNDRLIVQIGGEAQVLETSDHTLQEVARATNVKDSEVILSTDTTQFLDDKKVVYSVSEQRAYWLPALPTNVYIQSVSNGKLTYAPGSVTVDLTPIPDSISVGLLAIKALRRSYAEAGINLVDGSFARGGTVSAVTDVLFNEIDGKVYSWGGTLPKTVSSDSTPETTGGIGVTAWNAIAANGKREIAHLEDYLPDLLGITDYSDIVQRVVDTSNIVLFGKGRCKISSVTWPTRATVIGMGNDSIFVVSEDVDVFKLPAGGRFSNFAVEVTNPDYTKDIFKLATSYLIATSTGREDDERTETRNITIRATSIPNNSASLNCNTIKLLADANGKGLYKHVFDNIDMHRCGRPVDIETTGVDAWVNSNTISGCYAFATNGVVKMRNNGTNSEMRDNTVEVNLQNDINFPGGMVYDIPTSYTIKDNKISGYIWDVIPDQTAPGGCKFGNAGLNIVFNPMTSSNSFGGNYLYIGSLSDSEGIAFVDFSISRYAQSVDTLKIAVVAGVPSIRYYNTNQSLGLDFRYQKIGDIIYLFMKTDVVYLDITITNSACFTPGSHTGALASVPNSEAMPLPASRKAVTANSTGSITGFNFLLSMTDRLAVSELTDINQIPIGGNSRGLTAFTCAGSAIGLQTPNQFGCLFFDKGNITGANNYGSNLIAFSQDGDIFVRTYHDGWGGWKKVTMTAYP